MTEEEKQRFAQICQEETETESERLGIGTYMEKRLHRVLKRFYSESEEQTEVSVGSFIADIKRGNHIIEIQSQISSTLVSNQPKLRYYLEQTELCVTVVHPILADHMLIRMDRETGEVLRRRRAPRKGIMEVLPELYWIRHLVPHDRLTVCVLLLQADEYRYSERMRYRKAGAYEAELFPQKILEEQSFTDASDYSVFLPDETSFTAAEFAAWSKLRGRPANYGLRALCEMGLLDRERIDRKYLYHKR